MNLQNGYKVIYDSAVNNEHTFYASKTGVFADAEEIIKLVASEYKLVYEKNGCVYGSKTGIPAENDHCFTEFNKVFCAHVDEDEDSNCDKCEEEMPAQTYNRRSRKAAPTVEEPVVEETPAVKE